MERRSKLRRAAIHAGALGAVALLGACAAPPAGMGPGHAAHSMAQHSASTIVAAWPTTSREVAGEMMEKYGAPDEATATRLTWFDNGPWKRTIVYRDPVPHRFPMPHQDLLEQVIDYRAPLDRYDEIAMYDGSVILERTKGEMAARCDKEGANFLALNLANEVATGARNVEDARRMYGEQVRMMKNGQMTPYTSGLMFSPAASGRDPDQPIM